jgi:hypothetical protein
MRPQYISEVTLTSDHSAAWPFAKFDEKTLQSFIVISCKYKIDKRQDEQILVVHPILKVMWIQWKDARKTVAERISIGWWMKELESISSLNGDVLSWDNFIRHDYSSKSADQGDDSLSTKHYMQYSTIQQVLKLPVSGCVCIYSIERLLTAPNVFYR